MTDLLTITRPDDMHVHLRDGAMLAEFANSTARQFARALVMPNLKPPITTVAQAEEYFQRIKALLPSSSDFRPLLSLYLTEQTSVTDILAIKDSENVVAVKLYPAGATTNSQSGVHDLSKVSQIFETMQQLQIPLLVHGEVTDPSVDVFDREAVFIDQVLQPLCADFPELPIVLEHITTEQAVDFVQSTPYVAGKPRLAATITPQHLLFNRNDIFKGGVNPHYYCLPILKRERHRLALCRAAVSGLPQFFLGTDSAPHSKANKENSCGCAGCYSSPYALEFYATIFDQYQSLHKLEAFASHYAADFYRLPRNQGSITLKRQNQQLAASFTFGDEQIIPLGAGSTLPWQVLAE